MEFARIDGAAIAEIRSLNIGNIPAHKRHLWRPIESERPSHHPDFETITGPVLVG